MADGSVRSARGPAGQRLPVDGNDRRGFPSLVAGEDRDLAHHALGLGPGDLVVVSHEHTIRAALAVLADRGWRDIDWDAPVPPGSVRSVPLRH
mgnify:CR=1 FL=1